MKKENGLNPVFHWNRHSSIFFPWDFEFFCAMVRRSARSCGVRYMKKMHINHSQSCYCFFILPGIIWLDNVNCSGAEAKLTDCGTAGWGRHNCRNSEAAGVKCLARKEPVMLADTASEKTEKVFYGIPRIPPPSVNQVHRFSQSYFEVHLISTLKF